MKDEWYGDRRDLVKWATLLHLAEKYGAVRILQVAYYRASEWAHIEIDGKAHAIPPAVLEHFRAISQISKRRATCRIDVLEAPLVDRQAYARGVSEAVAAHMDGQPQLVFLDPDTGLAPRKANLTHVLEAELTDVWQALKPRHVLVF